MLQFFHYCLIAGCKIIADANANNSISEPSDFFGPPKNGASWGTDNGQKSRYCNFQDSTYTYQRKEVSHQVCPNLNKNTIFSKINWLL